MNDPKRVRVLFLCTGNSCRSIMAEAMLRHLGGDRFSVWSAGSRPAGFIHPLAIYALGAMRIPLGELRSKSWDEMASREVDVVITLCDAAANESCPVFPGAKHRVHWSLPDPVFFEGDEPQRLSFALAVAGRIRARIEGLAGMDWSARPETIERRLRTLGEI